MLYENYCFLLKFYIAGLYFDQKARKTIEKHIHVHSVVEGIRAKNKAIACIQILKIPR